MNLLIKKYLVGAFTLSTLHGIPQSNVMYQRENPTNISTLLRCLSEIESGNNDKAIGRYGERSRYQILITTWQMYSDTDFYVYCTNYEMATSVARAHLSKTIIKFHNDANRKPTPAEIYVIWNAGYSYYFNKQFKMEKVPKALYNKAKRFSNLYDKFYPEEAQQKLKI
jgi:hypothetical protein